MIILGGILFIVFGYLCGSVLFGVLIPKLFHKDITSESKDKNPGTVNAFTYGGFWCGVLTLAGDMAKGFVPTLLYQLYLRDSEPLVLTALVIVAPVIGHILPVFFGFRGGKGIAVGFGSMLGLAPGGAPAFIVAGVFIFFSLIVKISPNYYRTIFTYLCGMVTLMMAVRFVGWDAWLGDAFISAAILLRLAASPEEKEKLKVSFL